MNPSKIARATWEPEGGFVELDSEPYYRIRHSDRLPAFLMSLASDTDLWMFVTSTGGLTAGRVSPDGSLFPYDNVDRLEDAHLHTGPITLLRVRHGADVVLWQPFAERRAGDPPVERRLYKNVVGDRIVFEESAPELGLVFRYRWSGCDTFGFVRTASLSRVAGRASEVEILDGVRNVLPHGVPLAMYQQQSSLVDAYKRNECDAATGLAIFSLTSRITDRAEAVEELRANVVWSVGLDGRRISVADDAVNAFRAGEPLQPVALTTGRRGHYLVHAAVTLAAGETRQWHLIADAGLGPVDVVRLRERLRSGGITGATIEHALDAATSALTRIVASADGLQASARTTDTAHHFANVLFNNMRGGVFPSGYSAPRTDIVDFIRSRDLRVSESHAALLAALPDEVDVFELIAASRRTADPDLERLCLEYLPLYFGRRHGDPSRPWNRFAIRVRGADGEPALHYEGNWRDVFQNWEALAMSFPGYLPGMIARFVDASTLDGFNPYRITRDGIEWEVADPDHPWGHIGYWGDHQIVYLLRLLEALQAFAPESLHDLLERRVFSYANVPYRLKSYAAMRADPHNTIDFDAGLDAAIAARVRVQGTDAKLVADRAGAVRHASLLEKLLVSALARLSNFVPDAGIWMNTQRPEWNDANNALAGHGVSTVTLHHLRRYLLLLEQLLAARPATVVLLAADIASWAQDVSAVLARHAPALGSGPRSDRDRKTIVDALGEAFERHRTRAYSGESPEHVGVPIAGLLALCRTARLHAEHSLAGNRRPDGLFHSYHVLAEAADDALAATPLGMMLEGQVAALSSGVMSAGEAVTLIESLFDSPMFDAARRSFMLYPERQLPAFLDKNSVPAQGARSVGLLADLLDSDDRSIVAIDAGGRCRFHPDLAQARVLADRLDALAQHPAWAARVARDRAAVLELYESVFHHRSFTGRSGTMYGYEGIGCIYWHMVGKLLLAVQEQALAASRQGDAAAPRLVAAYYRIRSGLGHEKSPAEFGAFPTDPYSHTPKHAGARQPGMTGQVKEEILTRLGELGVQVEGGSIRFRPTMLRRAEFLDEPSVFRAHDPRAGEVDIELPARSLAFTFGQVPVIYQAVPGEAWIRIAQRDGGTRHVDGDRLDAETSRSLFERRGGITRIDVGVPEHALLRSEDPGQPA